MTRGLCMSVMAIALTVSGSVTTSAVAQRRSGHSRATGRTAPRPFKVGCLNCVVEFPAAGWTQVQGLWFKGPCTLRTDGNGVLLAEKPGIQVKDSGGRLWVSRKHQLGVRPVFAFLPR